MGNWLSVAGDAIGAIGSVASGLFNANQASKNRAFQERMYEKQKNDNIEFWKMQNEYNLPSAELARLKDAGLNPLLMYGNGMSGMSAAGAISPATTGQGSTASANFQTNFADSLYKGQLFKATKENIEADTMKKTNEALQAADVAVKTREETRSKRYENDTFYERWDLQKQQILAENSLKTAYENTEVSKRNEIQANINYLEKQTDFIEAQKNNQNRLTDQQIKESDQRIENSIKTTAQTISTMKAEERKYLADAYYARAMAAIIDDPEYKKSEIDKNVQAVKNMILQGDVSGLEKELLEFKKSLMPTGDAWYDKAGYWWNKYIELTLGPIAGVLSSALSGIGAAATK